LLPTEWYQGCWIQKEELLTSGSLKSVAAWGLNAVYREAYNTGVRQFLVCFDRYTCHLDPCGVEDRLSISFLENWASRHKVSNWKS
jgi:hypothetical protein